MTDTDMQQSDLIDDYGDLNSYLIWFNDESPMHYYEMQPDAVVVPEYVRVEKDNLVDALKDAKRILALPKFPYDAISSAINRKFDNYQRDVKPWLFSVLELLEEEAGRQNIEIPEDLRGLWKQEKSQ